MSSIFKSNFLGIRPWRRHSLVLMVAGLAYIGVGASYIFAEPTRAREIALTVALRWFPIEFWGSVFVVAGGLAIVSSRWPPVAETWGYMVLTGLSAGWSATYAMGVIFANAPAMNLSGALNWGLLAFLWWAISGLTNPTTVVVKLDGPD